MPSGGIHGAEDYILQWKDITYEYGVSFSTIDNTSINQQESDKLLNADVLLISGGNTFQLLSNLRKSGLDKAIMELSHKQNVTIAGFSAGALVLTPTIRICNLPGFDENLVGINDLRGLGIVDFELFPHFEKQSHESILNEYRKGTNNQVREISDEEFISLSI
jgi:dipeptidase E